MGRRSAYIYCCLIAVLVPACGVHAAVFNAAASYQLLYQLENGSLQTEQLVFQPGLEQGLGRFGSFSALVSITGYGLTGKVYSSDGNLEARIRIERLRVDLYNAPVAGLELRIGVQQISAGKSDFFRHLDVINPPDLRDALAFDRRLGIPVIRLKWVMGMDSEWLFFAIPAPALAKFASGDSATAAQLTVLQQMWSGVNNWTEQTILPNPGLGQMTGGSMFKTHFGRTDLTLLTVWHYMPWLLADQLDMTGQSAAVSYSAVREVVLGAGFVTDLAGLGVRGEFAAHWNNGADLTVLSNGTQISQTTSVKKGWFYKAVLGLEYQCSGNAPFLKLEISRGFLGDWDDGTNNPIHWFGIVTVEQKLFQSTLTLSLSGGMEWVDPYRRWGRSTGAWFVVPAVQFQAGNNTGLELSAFLLQGGPTSQLAGMGYSHMLAFKCTVKI